jgi:hypothetical protein
MAFWARLGLDSELPWITYLIQEGQRRSQNHDHENDSIRLDQQNSILLGGQRSLVDIAQLVLLLHAGAAERSLRRVVHAAI